MCDNYNALKNHITELKALKNKLKAFDINFAWKHGRMPVKTEKEVMRPLYDEYRHKKAEIGAFLQLTDELLEDRDLFPRRAVEV